MRRWECEYEYESPARRHANDFHTLIVGAFHAVALNL